MQLHYNILWIDDDIQEGYIETGDINSIEYFLYDLGFEPHIETVEDESKLDNYLNKHKYDLIISDFNLNKINGDKIIESIREKGHSTEILFYSGNVNFYDDKNVKETLAFVDRITFHVGRDTLLDKIEKLIELTLVKLLELNATRGLITSATSELDVIIEDLSMDLIHNKLKKSKEDLDLIIEEYVSDFLDKCPERFRKKHDEIGFSNIFKSIEANRKWKIFRNLLKEYKKEDSDGIIDNFLKLNTTYFKQVIDVRNKFAHSKAEEVDGKFVLKGQYGKEDFTFDSDSCIEIRKNLIQHKENFDSLIDYFKIGEP